MVKISLKRQSAPYHMVATNEEGKQIHIDRGSDEQRQSQGMGPMQLLLAGIGGCSTIDIVDILAKQREPLDDIEVEVQGEREAGAVPSLYTHIHVHFKLYGNVNEQKAQRAIDLSMQTYCSVSKTLEKTAQITYSFDIIRPDA
jgi:putative redox protein